MTREQIDDLWRQRAVRREINARRVNEAIERGRVPGQPATFICECGHLGCNTTLEIGLPEYEAVRKDFDRFLIAPGHEIEAIDAVVERKENHLVVAKRGAGADAARRSDPRSEEADDLG